MEKWVIALFFSGYKLNSFIAENIVAVGHIVHGQNVGNLIVHIHHCSVVESFGADRIFNVRRLTRRNPLNGVSSPPFSIQQLSVD